MADPDREIPQESRALVTMRDGGRCFSCGGTGRELHHRRSRRVRAPHRHCGCNLILVCRTCHTLTHSQVLAYGLGRGLIVSQWVDEPLMVPASDPQGRWWQLLCNGDYVALDLRQVATDGFGGYIVVGLEV